MISGVTGEGIQAVLRAMAREINKHRAERAEDAANARPAPSPRTRAERQAVNFKAPVVPIGRAEAAKTAKAKARKAVAKKAKKAARPKSREDETLMSDIFAGSKLVVVKVGSALLVDGSKGKLRRDWLASLCDDVAALKKQGAAVDAGVVRLHRAWAGGC